LKFKKTKRKMKGKMQALKQELFAVREGTNESRHQFQNQQSDLDISQVILIL